MSVEQQSGRTNQHLQVVFGLSEAARHQALTLVGTHMLRALGHHDDDWRSGHPLQAYRDSSAIKFDEARVSAVQQAEAARTAHARSDQALADVFEKFEDLRAVGCNELSASAAALFVPYAADLKIYLSFDALQLTPRLQQHLLAHEQSQFAFDYGLAAGVWSPDELSRLGLSTTADGRFRDMQMVTPRASRSNRAHSDHSQDLARYELSMRLVTSIRTGLKIDPLMEHRAKLTSIHELCTARRDDSLAALQNRLIENGDPQLRKFEAGAVPMAHGARIAAEIASLVPGAQLLAKVGLDESGQAAIMEAWQKDIVEDFKVPSDPILRDWEPTGGQIEMVTEVLARQTARQTRLEGHGL